jgi:hypothetical protein
MTTWTTGSFQTKAPRKKRGMTIPQVLIKNATIDGRKVLFWEPKAMLPSPQPFGQELHI